MIKVEKVQVEEFRGIRHLVLEFNGKNYAVCGPNGTGKSGVVDALEFALTGNISRLSGEGMGNVSVKEHAPHVDSKNKPEQARVVITLKIPSLKNKEVVLERTVKNPSSPKVSPSSPEILAVLGHFEGHPEFVLSRREIIRYVIAKPGNRSEEVQALLRLDEVGELRSNLKSISNSCEKEKKDFERVKTQTSDSLAQALEISTLDKEKVLEAVNTRRTVLGLATLTDLTATTALNDGLATSTKNATTPKVNKISATADLRSFAEISQKITSDVTKTECADLKTQLTGLANNPVVTESVSRERFLRTAIEFVTEAACPVCDTEWDIPTLQGIIRAKLQRFEEVTKTRTELEKRLEPIISTIDGLEAAVSAIERLTKVLAPGKEETLSSYRTSLVTTRKALKNFLPLPDTISAIESITAVPEKVLEVIKTIEGTVAAIPEPTQQETARDFIVRAQDRLETYRKAARDADKSKQQAELAKKVHDIYTEVSNKALEGVYKDVESEFSTLYRSINSEDEGSFTAKLTPSLGKLGFDVDFYGRGHFPPGAYHSEGHQDAMGLCLYLALMRKLQGANFKFAVLDDVLMSVDTAHRREVCNLLKQHFSDTQLVLTTHDEVWLKLMTTSGLITSGNATRFSNWTPDHGPTEWRTRDVWAEIDTALKANDVRIAAGILRHYLEHVAREACDSLRAKVEFKGDGRYELGDMLPPAVKRLRDLILDGAKVADEWNKKKEAQSLREREKSLGNFFLATDAERWQINPAIHYNEWANLASNDFIPVVKAFRNLVEQFSCSKTECKGMYYLSFTGKVPDSLRCPCGDTNINLKKPEK